MPGEDLPREVDVLIAGSGIGGLTAAIAAHDHGAKVTIIEKAPKVGGTSAYSWGLVWVPNNHLQRPAGYTDSSDDAFREMRSIAIVPANEASLEQLISSAPIVAEYLEKKAQVGWTIVKYPENYYNGRVLETEPFPLRSLGSWSDKVIRSPHRIEAITFSEELDMGGVANYKNWNFDVQKRRIQDGLVAGGTGLISYLLKAVLDRGIRIFLNTRLDKLHAADGRISAVETITSGTRNKISCAQGALIALGGYDWNKDVASRFESFPDWGSSVPPFIEGDNLTLGGDVGASIGYIPNMVSSYFGIVVPGKDNFGKPFIAQFYDGGLPGYIIVNGDGERFGNEASYDHLITEVQDYDYGRNRYTNWPCFLIFDQKPRNNYPFLGYEPGEALPVGLVQTAGSLQELANMLGISAAGLQQTIARFNRNARNGNDPDFGRGQRQFDRVFGGDKAVEENPFLAPIESPPFYGVKLCISSAGRLRAGLQTNATAQVLTTRGLPIRNLCAVGNSVAFDDVGGMGAYTAGLPMCRGMTFGFVGGRFLATN
jgi:3-oxosteroid 1-dehydrogenase